jgi:hypothetical protein
MVKQAKLHQSRHGPTCKFGILVPKNRKEALAIDDENGNKKWQKSMDVEINQIDECNTFHDLGKGKPPPLEATTRFGFILSMMLNMTLSQEPPCC